MSGFVLCLMDVYTGARWGELVGQQRHEYDAERRGIEIRSPLKEVGGKVYKGGQKSDDHHSDGRQRPPTRRGNSRPKKGRTKNPCRDSVRGVAARDRGALRGADGQPPRYVRVVYAGGHPWRPAVELSDPVLAAAWDGIDLDESGAGERRPPILPTFTFHEGRHTHSKRLTGDGIPEVARRARLGQKMKGIARVYDHVTPAMVNQSLDVLEERWLRSLASLYPGERAKLVSWFPHLRSGRAVPTLGAVAISSPSDD
jgi:integrase